jgi:pimeloyl-ACP methyl ester carboxylesterase
MNIPLFNNPFEAASKAASRAALKHLFDAMLWRSWKRPAPKGKGFTPIQFRNPDGCRLSGWVYRAPGKKCNRGTIFLCHGLRCNSSVHYDVARDLSRTHDVAVVSFDQRYHGRSSHEPYFPTFGSAEAGDLRSAMDKAVRMGLPKPFVATGTSLGGLAVQRAAVTDQRLSGALVISAPRDPWGAIWKTLPVADVLGHSANLINTAYGWNILHDGNPTIHRQPRRHRPLVGFVIGKNDHFGVKESRQVFDFFNGGAKGSINRFPGESREVRKFFYSIPGVAHPGLPGGDIWNNPIYRRFLHEFYQRIFTR